MIPRTATEGTIRLSFRRFRLHLTFFLVFTLAGCVATGFPEALQSWVGGTGARLRAAYDAAPAVYTLDERTEILTWLVYSFEPVDPLSDESQLISPSATMISHSRRCAVSFTVVDGVVQEWDWRGNNRHLCPVPRPPDRR